MQNQWLGRGIGFGAALVALAGPGQAAARGQAQDPVAWLTQHAVPIRSIQFDDDDFSDLAPLKAAIGGSRVVLLGEQTHGDGACFAAKARLVRFLHSEMGFDVLAWESGMDEMRRVDRALVGGADVAECQRLGLFGIWSLSQQVRPLLDYVKVSKATPRPLEMAGVDSQVTSDASASPWPREVVEFFDKADTGLLTPQQRAAPKEVFDWLAALGGKEPPKRPEAVERLREMAAMLAAPGEKMAAAYSAAEIGFTRRTLINAVEYALQSSSGLGDATDDSRRDRAMGQNLVFLAREYYPRRKIIVWAASLHNARNLETVDGSTIGVDYKGFTPMGHVAYESLGKEIYSIMFLAHRGRTGRPWTGASPLPEAPKGSLDALMHQAGKPYLFVDFRALPADDWLRQPIVARPLGYAPMKAVWPGVFDAAVFTDRMYPSTRVGVEPPDAKPGAK